MPLLELQDCSYAPLAQGPGLTGVSFSLSPGDFVLVESDEAGARLFLRALATLEKPLSGTFAYQGRPLSFARHRDLLPYKSKVGYIAPDAALFGNRSLGENLVFAAHWYGAPPGDPEEDVLSLAGFLGIRDQLSLRPSAAPHEAARLAVAAREITKGPEILLVDRPGQDLSRPARERLLSALGDKLAAGTALVIHLLDLDFDPGPAPRRVTIENGRLWEGEHGA